jgi:hypothetical protein
MRSRPVRATRSVGIVTSDLSGVSSGGEVRRGVSSIEGPITVTETTGEIDPRYGDPSATPPTWTAIEQRLVDAQLYWIITVRADGRPHAVPLVGVWVDGVFAFCTGSQEQKTRNLDGNQHVAVSTGSTGAGGWDTGTELVVEGTATRVTESGDLQVLADAWGAKYGDDWRFRVQGQGFVEAGDTGGSSEVAWVYRVVPAKVIAFGGGHGQTAYRF